jgi:hypothetical protein
MAKHVPALKINLLQVRLLRFHGMEQLRGDHYLTNFLILLLYQIIKITLIKSKVIKILI